MTKSELLEIIRNGENSGVEFKRDEVLPGKLAKEIAALLNLEGGHILLGVDDDGSMPGLTRGIKEVEEWVMEVGRSHIQPSIIPYWETMVLDDNSVIGIISLPSDSPDKPYNARQGQAWVTMVRVGTTTRPATREEESRLYQASGLMRYDIKPVPGTTIKDLDMRRLTNYFRDIRKQECPPQQDEQGWSHLLTNTEFMTNDRGKNIPTVGGILLFGRNPHRVLPQSGITAVAYVGTEKDYAARERALLRGPLVALLSESEELVESGLVEQLMDFVRRNSVVEAWIDENGRRREKWQTYPLEAVREAIVNALAHRDYTITVTDIEVAIYQNRVEIISPGRLPNTVTVERMRYGCRASRNELVKEVLRDYRYIEATGMGVPRKIIQGMLDHNGIEPDLIEEEHSFMVRLRNE